jgi:hypothetical protein
MLTDGAVNIGTSKPTTKWNEHMFVYMVCGLTSGDAIRVPKVNLTNKDQAWVTLFTSLNGKAPRRASRAERNVTVTLECTKVEAAELTAKVYAQLDKAGISHRACTCDWVLLAKCFDIPMDAPLAPVED